VLAAAGAGIHVPPEDPPALAAAIRGLSADHAASAEMGSRGRAFVTQHYTRGEGARRLEALLREVVRQ